MNAKGSKEKLEKAKALLEEFNDLELSDEEFKDIAGGLILFPRKYIIIDLLKKDAKK